jgi:hypothetical protein
MAWPDDGTGTAHAFKLSVGSAEQLRPWLAP